jgi:cation diffusion facilitator CzcD-associated flavoprotein CzcO
MSREIKRVAVVGAGPAGAITIDALVKEDKFDTIRVFERQEKPGGIWYVQYQVGLQFPTKFSLIGSNIQT